MDLNREMFEELKFPKCDLLLIGDGSGTYIQQPCGFACIAYDFNRCQYVVHTGCFNHGTNNFAELVPYVHALYYDHYLRSVEQNIIVLKHKRKVEIVSDSELTVKQGNKIYSRVANSMLWAAIDKLVSVGYNIHWNHVLRNTNELSTLCDKLAGEQRRKMLDS